MSAASPDAKRRVKLYALNSSRTWDDKGTGHVTSCYHEPLDGMSLLVRNEADGSLLLESKIQLDIMYQRQQGTLIVWTESDNCDLALSFQEQDGCNEIWEVICQVQGKDPSFEQENDEEQEEVRLNIIDCNRDKLPQILEQITAFSQTSKRRDVLTLEYVDNNYITKLIEIFRKADEEQDLPVLHKLYEIFKQLFLYDRTTLTECMLAEDIIMDVIGVFEYEPPAKSQEDNDQDTAISDHLSPLGATMSDESENEIENENEYGNGNDPGIDNQNQNQHQDQNQNQNIKLNDKENENENGIENQIENQNQPQNTNTNTNENNNNDITLNAPSTSSSDLQPQNSPQTNRKRHREYLMNGTKFKQVIPFTKQRLVDKIHQTYRVQYLQTSVLPSPSILEENPYSALTNILFFSKVEIVTMIQEDGLFLALLFQQLISSETGIDRKRELIQFLKEYCIFSQSIQPKQRENFFKTLAAYRVLTAVEVALSSNDPVIKSAAIDIFTYLVEYSPQMTREHANPQKSYLEELYPPTEPKTNILQSVIEHITTDQDPELGTATQLSCIIKLLLDTENMVGDAFAKHSFLEFFYSTCMQSLVEPIKNATTPTGDIEPSANDRKTAQLLSIILDVLTFFIEQHFGQFKNYIANSDLLPRIISLIKSRHKFLVLGVVRFLRRLLATQDKDCLQIVLDKVLFGPIIQVLKNNNGRYNLVDSAILEMFEFIVHEEMVPIMNHLMTNFGPTLESINYVTTFVYMRDYLDASPSRRSKVELSPESEKICTMRLNMFGPCEDETDPEQDKEIDPDSDDAAVSSDQDAYPVSDLEFILNDSKNDDEEIDEEDAEDVEEEDDIQMDDENCADDLEPQFKKKKTK